MKINNVISKRSLAFYVATTGMMFFLGVIAYFSLVWQGSVQYAEMPTMGKIFVLLGLLGGLTFWFCMLADFFKNTAINRRIFWGFSLIFFWWVAALLYFFIYFLPREKSKRINRINGKKSKGSDSIDLR